MGMIWAHTCAISEVKTPCVACADWRREHGIPEPEATVTATDGGANVTNTVYVVMIDDSEDDPAAEVFTTAEAAVAYARSILAERLPEVRHQDDGLGERFTPGNWLFYAVYSVEGDYIWVIAKELRP